MIHEAVLQKKQMQEKPTSGESSGHGKESISRRRSELPLIGSPSLPTGSAPALKFIWKALKILTNCLA